jgi:ribosome assembly protein RRB1
VEISLIRPFETTFSDSDEEDESDDDMDGDPVLESRSIPHIGGVNRVRSMPQASNIVATWSDTQRVYLWDVTKQLASLEGKTHTVDESKKEIFSFSGHAGEGFAMDWSPVHTGKLLTGDCSRYIYLWSNVQSSWKVDKIPFTGHRLSVEDLQWSPTEATVFASCSSDRTVRIWDTRRKAGSMIDVVAHEDDVNVISWNRCVQLSICPYFE